MLNIALFTLFFAMPIVANVILGSGAGRLPYSTWSVAGFLYLYRSRWRRRCSPPVRGIPGRSFWVSFTLRYALLICAAANLAILVLGHWVLRIFGEAYAANGRSALTLMCLGGFGLIIKDHHVALRGSPEPSDAKRLSSGCWAWRVGRRGDRRIARRTHRPGSGLAGCGGVEALVCGPLVWRAYRGRCTSPCAADEARGRCRAGRTDPPRSDRSAFGQSCGRRPKFSRSM